MTPLVTDLIFDSGGANPRLDGKRLVDVFCYVWHWTYVPIPTECGPVTPPFGFLSDGDSSVRDLYFRAWFAHDVMYLLGKTDTGWVTQWEADTAYGRLVREAVSLHRNPAWRLYVRLASCIRPVALYATAFAGPYWSAWQRYREIERRYPGYWHNHIMPHAECWEFPTMLLRDAVWVG